MHCVSRGGSYLVNSFCDLQEENQWKKESYQACWLSLVLETRPQYKLTLSETDSIRKESYKQQQVIDFMVERSPSQTLCLGHNNKDMMKHQLPLNNTRRIPHHATTTSVCKEQEPIRKQESGQVYQQEETAKTLSKPVRVNFRASGLMSSPGETSHRVQRRE